MKKVLALLVPLLLLLGATAFGQTVQFTAQTTTGAGEVTPVLSWSTTPAAESCLASGQWSGEKGDAGTETLPVITSSATYILSCRWPGDDTVEVAWINPTENTDGSPYTDPKGTLIEYSPDGQAPWFLHPVADATLNGTEVIPNPATTTSVTGLAPGNWFFRAYAINLAEVSSDPSEVVEFVVEPPVEAEETVSITVNTKPSSPTGLSVQ